MSRVVTLRTRRAPAPPAPPTYAGEITATERAAAEIIMRGAQRLQSILCGPFTTVAAKARVPAIRAEIENALAELGEGS